MAEHYAVHSEGSSWAWSTTPGDTAADFEKAKAEAAEMSGTSGRNWVVRHNDRQVSRVICTATPEDGIVWPRLASPPVPIAEVTHAIAPRETELEPGA
jgi:hypothetical protein